MTVQPQVNYPVNGGGAQACEILKSIKTLPQDGLADWAMICVPRTASTSLSMMLNLRGSNAVENSKLEAPGHYFGHTPASSLVKRFGLNRWRRTFSFGFVRNPWDRMVSVCARINAEKLASPDSFADWLNGGCLDQLNTQHVVVPGEKTFIHQPCSDFILPCSYIGRFETFEADLERICRILGRPVPDMKHHETRPRKKPYQDYYTPAARNWVANHCWKDIQIFGYSFEE